MTTFRAWLLVWLAGMSSGAFGAQILKIAASRKMMAIGGVNPSSFSVNDALCVERDAANRVCGQVVKVLAKGIIFSAANANHGLQQGDRVTLRRNGRSVASQEYDPTMSSTASTRRGGYVGRRNDVSAGVEFIQPMMIYQRMLGSHFAIGLMPIYMDFSSLDGSLSGIGGHLMLNYYSKSPFKGWWLFGGVGYYSFTATLNATQNNPTTTEKGSTISALVGGGYRFVFGSSGWNLGLGAGVQYLANPQTTSLQFSSILPAASVDVGYAF